MLFTFSSVSSVTQSCLTLCDPMDCSTPGFPVRHQLPKLAQTHVHRVSEAIQPSHPLSVVPFYSRPQSFRMAHGKLAIIYQTYDIMRYICCYGLMCTALHLGSKNDLEGEYFCLCCLCGGVRRWASVFEVQLRALVGVCKLKKRRAF